MATTTYDAKVGGRNVKVTIPEADSDREMGAILDASAALIREIQKRDGEGNTIPAHLYGRLANLIRAAGGKV